MTVVPPLPRSGASFALPPLPNGAAVLPRILKRRAGQNQTRRAHHHLTRHHVINMRLLTYDYLIIYTQGVSFLPPLSLQGDRRYTSLLPRRAAPDHGTQ